MRNLSLVLGLAVLVAAWSGAGLASPTAIQVRSAAFRDGAAIPARYTCSGADVSPALAWSGLPKGTRSVAVVCDDPDAPGGTWVHWVLYDLPPTQTSLPEGLPHGDAAAGGRQGTNDFQKVGYNGPCPPGGTHRYLFHVYALDRMLALAPRATRARLDSAMRGHVLAEGRLLGKFRR